MIDIDAIKDKYIGEDKIGECNFTSKEVEDCMKEAIKAVLPIILSKVADKAKAIDNTYSMGGWGMKGGSVSVSKESITSLEQELLKELL